VALQRLIVAAEELLLHHSLSGRILGSDSVRIQYWFNSDDKSLSKFC